MFDKLNLLKSKSLSDITAFGTYKHDALVHDIDFFGPDDVTYAHLWPYEQFNYSLNANGYRGPAFPTETDIAAFGCSFTAGLGLPEDYLWHNLVASELQLTSLNFGVSGASVKSIAELFLITSKHIQIKHAVFLLPSYNRMQIGIKHMKKNMLTHLSLIPGLKSELSFSYGVDVEMLYKHIPDDDQIKTFKNDMYLLDYVAKHRNIKVYFSSWDGVTYNLLNQLNLKNSTTVSYTHLTLPTNREV